MNLESVILSTKQRVKKGILSLATASALVTSLNASTVDFTENDGVATYNSTSGKYVLNMNLKNNTNTEPAPTPYNDYVSEFKIQGIYSSSAPTFTSRPAGFGSGNGGYTTITLVDSVNNLWDMVLGTNQNGSRIAPGGQVNFLINFTIPSGYNANQIQYGNVNVQGLTSTHGNQPFPTPDTFIGPIAPITIESATKIVNGQTQIFYTCKNPNSAPVTQITFPIGFNEKITSDSVPQGWTRTPAAWQNPGQVSTTLTGNLSKGSITYAVQTPLAANGALPVEVSTSTNTYFSAAVMPGNIAPQHLYSWRDNQGLHSQYIIRPGSKFSSSYSFNLKDWVIHNENVVMGYDSNIYQDDQPQGLINVPSYFVRIQQEIPDTVTNSAILNQPVKLTAFPTVQTQENIKSKVTIAPSK